MVMLNINNIKWYVIYGMLLEIYNINIYMYARVSYIVCCNRKGDIVLLFSKAKYSIGIYDKVYGMDIVILIEV